MRKRFHTPAVGVQFKVRVLEAICVKARARQMPLRTFVRKAVERVLAAQGLAPRMPFWYQILQQAAKGGAISANAFLLNQRERVDADGR